MPASGLHQWPTISSNTATTTTSPRKYSFQGSPACSRAFCFTPRCRQLSSDSLRPRMGAEPGVGRKSPFSPQCSVSLMPWRSARLPLVTSRAPTTFPRSGSLTALHLSGSHSVFGAHPIPERSQRSAGLQPTTRLPAQCTTSSSLRTCATWTLAPKLKNVRFSASLLPVPSKTRASPRSSISKSGRPRTCRCPGKPSTCLAASRTIRRAMDPHSRRREKWRAGSKPPQG
mmetsp:Transcript_56766/g.160170  ORF Transcript_56766/g.160170 Transcript_56766/m.160170 type:complete len:229 (-) Transcript_56766:562-1248(-)